ncbi:hypothetical protein PIB30_089700 [Stylosanthes scabra]|uniref:FAR1 domain-containing protein n=1 Tax=Stylosanthes scabra TaxID=79078 RepID=A0ABU6QUP1_9FABA|nr:hypothetical protein [Stylosanthes scabra]
MSDIFQHSEMDEQYEENDMNKNIEENICAHSDGQHHLLYEEDSTNEQNEPEEDCEDTDEQHEFAEDCGDESSKDKFFSEFQQSENAFDDAYVVDSTQDIAILDFSIMSVEKIHRYHFGCLQTAFDFYLKYSKFKGFSARKSNFLGTGRVRFTDKSFYVIGKGSERKSFT